MILKRCNVLEIIKDQPSQLLCPIHYLELDFPKEKASDFSVLASTLENAAFESSPHLRKTETQQDSKSTLLVVDGYPNCTLTEEEIARHGNGVCNPELAFDFDDMEWRQTINSEECGLMVVIALISTRRTPGIKIATSRQDTKIHGSSFSFPK